MSLVRLLTAGKSLVGIKNDPTSRYQMRSRHLLPQFGSGKNPFTAPPKATPAAPATPVAPAVPQPATPGLMSPAEIAAARLKETKRLPLTPATEPQMDSRTQVPEPAAVASVSSSPAPAPAVPAVARGFASLASLLFSRLTSWLRRLDPRGWWTRRKPALKSVLPRFSRSAVQGELSLANIKVVRNDLSEGDMEIIAARPVARAKTRTARPVEEQAELAETSST